MATQQKLRDGVVMETQLKQLRLRQQQGIGARLRAARERAGMKQLELGKLFGLAESSGLWKYESGRRALSVHQIEIAAAELGVSCDWLITGRESPAQPLKTPLSVTPATAPAAAATTAPAAPGRAGAGLAQPIIDLLALGWLGKFDNADIDVMNMHLGQGWPSGPHDLEVSVRMGRCMRDNSDANNRAWNEAVQRRALALGYKPVAPTAHEEPTGKHARPPTKERRKR